MIFSWHVYREFHPGMAGSGSEVELLESTGRLSCNYIPAAPHAGVLKLRVIGFDEDAIKPGVIGGRRIGVRAVGFT